MIYDHPLLVGDDRKMGDNGTSLRGSSRHTPAARGTGARTA